jgi:hypothetical protein
MHNSLLFKGKTAVEGMQLRTYSRTGATDGERFDPLYRSYRALFDHRF